MRSGSVSLGEVAARTSHIEIACSRCDRKGRCRLAKLVARLGPDFAMTDLGAALADCPGRSAAAHHERCDVFFPMHAQIMADDRQTAAATTDDF